MRKKFLALSLCAIIGFSTYILCGCTQQVNTYEIFVTSSNVMQGGTAHGTGNYKENSTVTLTAVPNEENGFLAWIKNNEQIVSYTQEYSFKATSDTAGKYTALFSSDEYDFVKLSTVSYSLLSFKLEDNDYNASITSFSLSYNTKADLYKTLATFADIDLDNGEDNVFENIEHEDRIFYFDTTYHFKLQINLKYTNLETNQIENDALITKFSINFSDLFDDLATTTDTTTGTTTTITDGKCKLTLNTTSDSDDYSVILDVNSLTSSEAWSDSSSPIKHNIQSLSIVFDYPILHIS